MKQKEKFISLAKYGLLLAVVLIITSALKHGILSNPSDTILMFCNLVLIFPAYIFCLFKGIKFAKEKIYIDNFSKIKGILSGLFIGLIAAILFSIYTFIETKISPEYYANQLQQQIEMISQLELSQEDFTKQYNEIIAVNKTHYYILSSFFTTILGAGLVSLFATTFLYKNQIK